MCIRDRARGDVIGRGAVGAGVAIGPAAGRCSGSCRHSGNLPWRGGEAAQAEAACRSRCPEP
eukprot:452388-Alexandrium_andersonii.AAC.1